MNWQGKSRRRSVLRWAAALAAMAMAAVLVVGVAGAQSPGITDPGDLPVNPQWLSNTLTRAATTTSVQNNLAPGALENRNQALKAWSDAQAAWKAGTGKEPSPLAKPEYLVVWSAKQNGADLEGSEVGQLLNNATVNPQGLADLLNPQFLPGLDGFQVIDERKLNVNGTENPDYGTVVNFVQLPLPWGVETEAHHMQYDWNNGDPVIAGGLFNDTTFVLGAKDIPNLTLQNIVPPQDTPGGTIPDAYDSVGDGRFIGTYMGGPEENFGGSPGEVVTFKPDAQKGLVVESETAGGHVGGVATGNANGVPEPCSVREGRPLGTCANPHGIQIRQDLETMVTADYAEPREIVLDPVKTIDKYTFRPTFRTWDTSDPPHPKLVRGANMPTGAFDFAQRAHQQMGIMEAAKTWPYGSDTCPGMIEWKGAFAGSMCGGGIFFTPDITKLEGDASSSWNQVWNDGLSALAAGGDSEFGNEPGACAGGAWHQVSRNNKLLFRSVQGRAVAADNYFDQGSPKMIYDIDIRALVRSAKDGEIQCDLSRVPTPTATETST